MFTTFFTDHPVTNWATAKTADTEKFGVFFRAMLENGVYLASSQFEAGFMSTAHKKNELEITARAAEQAFRRIHKV
jgi:glutamate-1-semialdehyde 2,1-aminomutase